VKPAKLFVTATSIFTANLTKHLIGFAGPFKGIALMLAVAMLVIRRESLDANKSCGAAFVPNAFEPLVHGAVVKAFPNFDRWKLQNHDSPGRPVPLVNSLRTAPRKVSRTNGFKRWFNLLHKVPVPFYVTYFDIKDYVGVHADIPLYGVQLWHKSASAVAPPNISSLLGTVNRMGCKPKN
jgi:hypothetical protein